MTFKSPSSFIVRGRNDRNIPRIQKDLGPFILYPDLKGSAPSECMMAVWVLRVAASLYTRLHTGHGRGS